QLNTLLGGVLGMIIGLGLIFLLDFLDDTYKSLNDFSQSEEVNILGSIRKIKGRKLSDKLVAFKHPHSPVTESYRIIRSRIRFKPTDKLTRSIMVTSSMPEEGKSMTAANLAVVFAQANYKTVIVDADLRHPALHEVFKVNNEVGLGDLLSSTDFKIQDCIQDTSANNLKILTSGMPLLDPSERLGSDRMKDILDELKSVASVIIVDSPPVLIYADAIALSGRLDGVIMVIQAGKSTRGAITQALFDLQNANANLLGSVFNQSPKSDTFSVNKAYMQERPQLSAPMALTKKAKANAGPFEDLRDSAVPLNEKLEIPGLVREETTMDVIPSGSIDNDEISGLNSLDGAIDKGFEPEHKNEIADLDSLDLAPDEISVVGMSDSLEQEYEDEVAEFQSLENETETIDHSHEETMTEVGNVAVHEHQGEVAEEGNLESETEVNEQLSGFQENAESRDKKSRKRRSRKNKVNGSKNEEVAGNQINVPSGDETDVRMDMDQISEPVDHDVVLVDRNKDE
nr:polysaccharide biosynthesis tyrosine autokinase [Chloroflexota bacterium]